MIIKSHIIKGYRNAAEYMEAQGANESVRTVAISDIDATTMDEAFKNMWAVAYNSKIKKPLHHISINPRPHEQLTDDQVKKIVERCELKYRYQSYDHQHVIVEHIKNNRQHFHVIWNRVSLKTGQTVDPGFHWRHSIKVAREMEMELGLQRPCPRWAKPPENIELQAVSAPSVSFSKPHPPRSGAYGFSPRLLFKAAAWSMTRRPLENKPDSEKKPFHRPEWELADLLAWAWEHKRVDVLAQFGIFISAEALEP